MKSVFDQILHTTSEIGYVQSTSFPLVYVKGLPNVKPGEVVLFESGQFGQVKSLSSELVEVLVYSKKSLTMGLRTVRTGQYLDIPVGSNLLGKSLDALGQPLYQGESLGESAARYSVEKDARGIHERKEIDEPMLSGVSIVDMMVPLGRGQRELLIGDRQTGKTSFALQTLMNQAKQDVKCIYACIGKKKADIEYVENFINLHNLRSNTVVVTSGADDPLGNIFLTPYTAMSIAEYFRDQGQHVLIILDDLTTHAKYYREISLLGGKFPGRESYPGDIFYTHSRLLERAGNFFEGSITCLPIVNTVEGDISGYIQTNLMSMTDGHIFFDKDLFYSGQRPAVNYFISVTRVGRQTQSKLRWSINRELSTFLALYKRTENFVHFGAELSEGIKSTLSMGSKMFNFFTQHINVTLDIDLQILFFITLWSGHWNSLETDSLSNAIKTVVGRYEKDQNFNTAVKNLVNHDEDVNSLLSKFMKELPNLQPYLEVASQKPQKDQVETIAQG